MNKIFLTLVCFLTAVMAFADNAVSSPDGRLQVNITQNGTRFYYAVTYDSKPMLKASPLGLVTNLGDFSSGLTLKAGRQSEVSDTYMLATSKKSQVEYRANELQLDFTNAEGNAVTMLFRVANNDVAFRYVFPEEIGKNGHRSIVVEREATGFNINEAARSFLCPQIGGNTGWMRTKPSYEEEYAPDQPLNVASKYGRGYTFPCLFRIPVETGKTVADYWMLISETGLDGNYCASHLTDYTPSEGYAIAFPGKDENNGIGSANATFALPGATPWRTITVGSSLRPIVETTVPWDVVSPKYKTVHRYKPGRYTWSWLVWEDASCNYDDQVRMIDLAATMGYEYVLVDALWDTQIGRDRVAELSRYAQGKGVSLMLWYNSNGMANDAPQGPRHCMNTSMARDREMRWLQSIGVKGIKVDFFGGDKQQTIQLYEDILCDADRYGLQVIFHGCTLPRGWERMYPNFVASEGALASENVFFTEHHARREGFEMTMHPFARNTVGSFDWGGVMMNRYMSRDNKSRHRRYTGDVFEMATAITNQTSVNCVAVYPNNLTELPQFVLDFLREIPTVWTDTRFVAGYPTRYAVIARKANDRWYVGGINGTDKPVTLTLSLPMLAGKTVDYYTDMPKKSNEHCPTPVMKSLKVKANGEAKVTIQPMGGIILK